MEMYKSKKISHRMRLGVSESITLTRGYTEDWEP
jgi:hypothetical protein